MRSPRLVYLRCSPVTTPATVRIEPSSSSRELGDRALDVAAQHRLGAHQRVVAHVEAEHLLLGAQPLRLVELDVGDRQPVVEHRAVVGGAAAEVEEAHRALVAFAPAAQRRVDDRLEHLQQALAGMAERVEARPP